MLILSRRHSCSAQAHLNARVHAEAAGGRKPVGSIASEEHPPVLVALGYLRVTKCGHDPIVRTARVRGGDRQPRMHLATLCIARRVSLVCVGMTDDMGLAWQNACECIVHGRNE